jgi:hypothetical protein
MTRRRSSRRAGTALLVVLVIALLPGCGLHADVKAKLDSAGPAGGAATTGAVTGATSGSVATTTAGGPVATVAGPAGATGGGTGGATTGTTGTLGSGPADSGTTGAGTKGDTGPGTVAGPTARSTLFTPAEDRIGITDKSLTLCVHAALTYGKAFGTETKDFNVFWDATNAEKGGVFGRQVDVTYENDDYKPTTAVQAATTCKSRNPFMLLGGIGFDQIPAVRNWAEQNHELYLHHTATIRGTAGQKYSFSELPTVERTGEAFAQMALRKYKGKRIGIIERDSENWTPGTDAFKAMAKRTGLKIVADTKVANNKGSYTDDLLAMKNANAEVVWAWMNALEATQLLKQAKAQNYSPNWMLFPFNLTSQTLDNDALTPVIDGISMHPAYSNKDYAGPFASYAADMKEFERQYAKFDPGIDLGGVGGDLLFLNWQMQKALYQHFVDCGQACTRNRFVDVLTGAHKRMTPSTCPLSFVDGHRGQVGLNFMETYRAPSGKVNWRQTAACVGP